MRFTITLNRLSRYLLPISTGYLLIPNIIFFAGWIKWYLALPLAILVIFPAALQMRRSKPRSREYIQDNSPFLKKDHLLLLVIIAAGLIIFSGIGGYIYQDTDWLKHNTILNDLIERPWPLNYSYHTQKIPLVYYVAYYLPAALLGKLGGWELANKGLFIWSLAGLILVLLWFQVLSHRAGAATILLFVIFSGLDILGQGFITPQIAAARPEFAEFMRWQHIEQWSVAWQYSANTTLLFWVPNQALAGWITTALVLYESTHKHRKTFLLFIWSLVLLWSPFAAIGLVAYLLADFLADSNPLRERICGYFSPANLGGLLLTLVIGLYYSAKLTELPFLTAVQIPADFILSMAADRQLLIIALVIYFLFCLLEFGGYAIIIYRQPEKWNRSTKAFFWTTVLSLIILPFYTYGANNDLSMRASIPALFTLAIFTGQFLYSGIYHKSVLGKIRYGLLILMLILGSMTVGIEFRRHAIQFQSAGTAIALPSADQVLRLDERFPFDDPEGIILQYVGSPQAPFFRYLAKME